LVSFWATVGGQAVEETDVYRAGVPGCNLPPEGNVTALGSTRLPNRMSRMPSSRTRAAALALLAAVLAACGHATRGAVQPAPRPATSSEGDLAAIAKARADSARYPYTAADVHFMSAMIGHHAQAIRMAGMAPSHAASSSVRTLAERIINAQQDEIGTMQQWLRDRQKPVPEARATGITGMAGMAGMAGTTNTSGAEHEMLMPGMLSEAQMNQLDQARGPEFDRLFLTFMIQHHRGAVAMVKQLFSSYGAGQDLTVFKFASDVNVDQTTEIARMERMLAALLFESRGP
jgi:uncharacterized protein (DUF305 family)